MFILASARSYSSVISAMVGQHPLLFGFPELKLFAYPTIGDLEATLPGTSVQVHRSPGLVRAVAQVVFGDQSSKSLEQSRNWLFERRECPGAEIFEVLRERICPRAAVEKSPEHALSDLALQRIVHAYPMARFIHLTREPLSTATSMRRHMHMSDEHALTFCLYSWYETNFRLVEFGARLSYANYLRLRAEDVLNEPPMHLTRIATWLGLPADTMSIEAMQHPERSLFAWPIPDPSGVFDGSSDPEFLRQPTLHHVPNARPVDKPNDWSGPTSLWSAIVELASAMDYRTE